MLGVCNDSYEPKPLKIICHSGEITSMEEYELDRSEVDAVGLSPRISYRERYWRE